MGIRFQTSLQVGHVNKIVMKCIVLCALLTTAFGILVNNQPATGNIYTDSHKIIEPYRWLQLKIENTGNSSKVVHNYPVPSVVKINFTSVFERNFLHQVLDLMESISQLQYMFVGETVGWSEVCYHHSSDNSCSISSILQYYNQSHALIDKLVWDKYGFFLEWDYLDHFLACASDLMMQHDNKFNVSCTDINDRPILPQSVLSGYDGVNFNNATSLIVTMLFSTERAYPNAVSQWQNELTKLIHNNNNENMKITILRPRLRWPYWDYD